MMDLVIDANILFSALIKDSFTSTIIFSDTFRLFTPEFISTELEKHKEEITPDLDDMVYFALALKLNCPIWSNDKKLKQQNKIKIYHTHELNKIT